ncbi:MAG: cysteine desulfurase [Planctomycetes bacterium]|nr:cysteine desulfurase [Planctomycetota bacterium]
MSVIDLDANASTRPEPHVAARVLQVLQEEWANPSSNTRAGEQAFAIIEESRRSVARLIRAQAEEILFTSGATESINLALQGVVRARQGSPLHLITSTAEHPAVLHTVEYLAESGVAVTALPTDRWGRVDPQHVHSALRDETALVCLIHGNNEIGTLNPIREVGRLLKGHPALLFVDAAQTLAYCPPCVEEDGIALMAMSAHKMYGPKGVGALYVRRGTRLSPLMLGGGQERGYRSGTMNTPAIAGFGVAADLAFQDVEQRTAKLTALRERMVALLSATVPQLRINGHPTERLPGHLSITIPYVLARVLQKQLRDRLAFTLGSACSEGSGQFSHVLRAIGLSNDEILWTFRLGLSRWTTEQEIEEASEILAQAIRKMQSH